MRSAGPLGRPKRSEFIGVRSSTGFAPIACPLSKISSRTVRRRQSTVASLYEASPD